jgi:hypothetical protein
VDHPAADQVADLIGGKLRPGQDRDHAGHAAGLRRVDILDVGVSVRRANKNRARFASPHDVIGILALAGDETDVFLAAHRRADPGRSHWRFPVLSLLGLDVRSYFAIARAPAATDFTMLW